MVEQLFYGDLGWGDGNHVPQAHHPLKVRLMSSSESLNANPLLELPNNVSWKFLIYRMLSFMSPGSYMAPSPHARTKVNEPEVQVKHVPGQPVLQGPVRHADILFSFVILVIGLKEQDTYIK